MVLEVKITGKVGATEDVIVWERAREFLGVRNLFILIWWWLY